MSLNDPILTISVASTLLKLHPRTLMLYERTNLIKPHRTGTKRRLFSIDDLAHLQFVKYLTQTEGLNLKGAALILKAIEVANKEGLNLKKLLFPYFRLQKLV